MARSKAAASATTATQFAVGWALAEAGAAVRVQPPCAEEEASSLAVQPLAAG